VRTIAALALLLAARAGAASDERRLEHGGLTRVYRVHLPPSYAPGTAAPLVIYLHGGGGNARTAFLDGMDKTADRLGFILAAPAGTGKTRMGRLRGEWNGGAWDGGRCCGEADDVGFIRAMIVDLSKRYSVDPRRIYATGLSNGGLMTNRLACELADTLAAVATVAPGAIPGDCKPARPIPVMDIQGTADTCNPIDGSAPTNPICGRMPYKRMNAGRVVAAWLKLDRCSQESVPGYKNGGASCVVYPHCAGGAEVEFCKVEGMGHAWPGGLEARAIGVYPVSHDITADQIWEFFQRHPKP